MRNEMANTNGKQGRTEMNANGLLCTTGDEFDAVQPFPGERTHEVRASWYSSHASAVRAALTQPGANITETSPGRVWRVNWEHRITH